VNTIDGYVKLKEKLALFFKDYVESHSLAECVDYYYFLESNSEEDALLFSISMSEKYIDKFETDIYDHIGCMLFHCGNNSMMYNLLRAENTSQNSSAKEYYRHLIESVIAGLQETAAHGYRYPTDLSELKKQVGFQKQSTVQLLGQLTTVESSNKIGELHHKFLSAIGNNHAGSYNPFITMGILPGLFDLANQEICSTFTLELIHKILVDLFFFDAEYDGIEKDRFRLENIIRNMIVNFSQKSYLFSDYLKSVDITFNV